MPTIVNSWNEWDPLKHVIVGRADDCHIPPEEPALDAKVPEDSDMRGQWGRRPQETIDRANELLDWRKNPDVVEEINARQIANREIWLIDKEKHLANLTRIQNEARAKGQYGVAGKMEELKGKVQGFYIDRNMTLTKEISEEDMSAKMKEMFPTREEFEAINKSMAEEMFGPMKKADKDKKEE